MYKNGVVILDTTVGQTDSQLRPYTRYPDLLHERIVRYGRQTAVATDPHRPMRRAIPGGEMFKIYAALLSLVDSRCTRNEEGATAVEYGLMVALIAVAIIAAVTLIGTNLATLFNDVAGKIAAA
jgi:pilus assembly protein Flp/PilA